MPGHPARGAVRRRSRPRSRHLSTPRPRADPPARGGAAPPHAGGGFTLLEFVFVVAIAAVLLGIAVPRLLHVSSRVAVGDARALVSSSVAAARAAAVRFGRVGYLVLDTAGDRLLVRVDTSALGGAPLASLGEVNLRKEVSVDLTATQTVLCFDPRGLAVAVPPCTGAGTVARLRRGAFSDSVVVSATGRVRP